MVTKARGNRLGGLEKAGWQRCLIWDYLERVPEEVGLFLHLEGLVLNGEKRRTSRIVSKAGGSGNGGDVRVWGMTSHCEALNPLLGSREKSLSMHNSCGLWLTKLFFVHRLLASSQLL